MPTELNEQSARAAIEAVVDPIYAKPLGELGVVHEVKLQAGVVSATLTVYALSDAKQKQLSAAIESALRAVDPGIRTDVTFQFEAPMRRTSADDPVPGVRNVVLVMSGKGGVGKSMTTVNLALALARRQQRVGVLDVDLNGPCVASMLGLSDRVWAVDRAGLSGIDPMEGPLGIKVASLSFVLGRFQPLSPFRLRVGEQVEEREARVRPKRVRPLVSGRGDVKGRPVDMPTRHP